jgi:hypothetical protein
MAQQEQQAASALERTTKLAQQLAPLGVTVAKSEIDPSGLAVVQLAWRGLFFAIAYGPSETRDDADIRKTLRSLLAATMRHAAEYAWNTYTPEIRSKRTPEVWAKDRAEWLATLGADDPNPTPIPFSGTVTCDESGFVTSVDLGSPK